MISPSGRRLSVKEGRLYAFGVRYCRPQASTNAYRQRALRMLHSRPCTQRSLAFRIERIHSRLCARFIRGRGACRQQTRYLPNPLIGLPGSSCLLDAFTVALLQQTVGGTKWFASTAQLQLASLQFCLACRSVRTLHLRVQSDTPRYLWATVGIPRTRRARKALTSRVPALRPEKVTWGLAVVKKMELSSDALSSLVSVVFGDGFNESVDNVSWPVGIRTIEFGKSFNRSLEGAS